MDSKPPKQAGVCDKCGGELYTREDDRAEAIRVRLQAYQESTAPLVHYYAAHGSMITVPADGAPVEVFQRGAKAARGKSRAWNRKKQETGARDQGSRD